MSVVFHRGTWMTDAANAILMRFRVAIFRRASMYPTFFCPTLPLPVAGKGFFGLDSSQ